MSLITKVISSIRQHPNSPATSHDPSGRSPYRYTPLPSPRHIRLIELRAGSPKEIITCTIHIVDLDSKPTYDALSYTWGDPRPPLLQSIVPGQWQRRFPILCNDGVADVTANLYHSLLKLRSLMGGVHDGWRPAGRIWIDALCINQDDLAERSAQVAIMQDIYSRAQMVVVWLGKEDRYTTPALRAIQHLAQIPDSQYPRLRSQMHAQSLGQMLGQPDVPDEALVAFFTRSWFKRVWIVQEAVLAPQIVVFCGKHHLPWDALVRCSKFIIETEAWRHLTVQASQFASTEHQLARWTLTRVGNAPNYLEHLKAMFKTATTGANYLITTQGGKSNAFGGPFGQLIWGLLMYGRSCDATDPKDHFYAMLGLMKIFTQWPSNRQLAAQIPVPHYSKSVKEVFTDCAVFMLESSQNLALLSIVEDRSCRSPELLDSLPSWVPDLTKLPVQYSLFAASIGPNGKPNWHPSKSGKQLAIGVPIDGHILCVKGAYFDTITAVSIPLSDLRWNHNWVDILDFMRPHWTGTVSGTTFAEALWRTLIADTEQPSGRCPASAWLGRAFAEMMVLHLVLLKHSARDNFDVKRHIGVGKKLLKGLWDQLREDPGAFFNPGIEKQDVARYTQLVEKELHYLAERRKRRRGVRALMERTSMTLAEISLVDRSGVFLRPRSGTIITGGRAEVYHNMVKAICERRRLFLTTGIYLGLGAMSAQQGDQVWILPGTNSPFILRSAGNGQFRLVGEAYVHGIMHGEADMNGSLRFQDIELI